MTHSHVIRNPEDFSDFVKDLVTLKTVVMMLKIQLWILQLHF